MEIKIRFKHMMIQYQIFDINKNKYRKMSRTKNINNFIKKINKTLLQRKKEILIRSVDVR